MGEVFDLINEVGTQAAAVDLLQSHQIVITEQLPDPLQVTGTAGVWQHMLPAARQVVPIALGADTHLDIETQ
jgi:hypothetical protein